MVQNSTEYLGIAILSIRHAYERADSDNYGDDGRDNQ
jgi:hypothetical protein